MRHVLLAFLLFSSSSTLAEPFDPIELGQMLGSADLCHLDVDSKAMKDWIKAKAPNLDFQWLEKVYRSSETIRVEVPKLSPEQLQFHCEQIKIFARALGILKG